MGAFAWIGFVGNLHLHEMLVGLAILVLTTIFSIVVFRGETLPFDLRWRDIRQGWQIPSQIVTRCGEITYVLVLDLFGRRADSLYRVCGFQGGMRDPYAVERMILAVVYSTVAPNFIVIGIDPHQNHMLFHQIRRGAVSPALKKLGATA